MSDHDTDFFKDIIGYPKRFIIKVILFLILTFAVIGFMFWILGWFSEAGQVAKQEFGPKASLAKYEWFIDTYEEIKVVRKNYEQYKSIVAGYGDPSLLDRWSRADYNSDKAVLFGYIAQYNDLVGSYNANSKKFNWESYNTTNSTVPQNIDQIIE